MNPSNFFNFPKKIPRISLSVFPAPTFITILLRPLLSRERKLKKPVQELLTWMGISLWLEPGSKSTQRSLPRLSLSRLALTTSVIIGSGLRASMTLCSDSLPRSKAESSHCLAKSSSISAAVLPCSICLKIKSIRSSSRSVQPIQ